MNVPRDCSLKPSSGQGKASDYTDADSPKLQALVYDILPSTTAVFSYAIGSRKLSANERFFVGSQTVVSLLQTTQTKQGVSFIVPLYVIMISKGRGEMSGRHDAGQTMIDFLR